MFGSITGTIVITTWWDIEYKKELEKGRALKKVNGRWVGK